MLEFLNKRNEIFIENNYKMKKLKSKKRYFNETIDRRIGDGTVTEVAFLNFFSIFFCLFLLGLFAKISSKQSILSNFYFTFSLF
jgi:hypothetical protein